LGRRSNEHVRPLGRRRQDRTEEKAGEGFVGGAPATTWDTDAARHYHAATKHSYESVRRRARPLDWANQPVPYKEYAGLPLEPIPPRLDRLLRLGAGVVQRRRGYEFRTYSSAGALYPIEVYVATADGLFHFHPRELGLRRLRDEDVRRALGGGETVLALTGILWRTAWKYDARGYRHLFWDAGTMIANLLELAPGEARVLTGFVDDEVNGVLGVDGIDEAALALLLLR
jgi:SagB-type dehydrogenase family enzyme